MNTPQIIVLAVAVIMSIAGLISMKIDKERAKRKAWRIKERTLFIIAFFGGIGSTAGMYLFRHKNDHWYFKVFFPIFAIIDAVGYTLLIIALG